LSTPEGRASDDRRILRTLAAKYKDFADRVAPGRVQAWRAHNDLQGGRPLLLFYPEGSWNEILPPSSLACEEPLARKIEFRLRARLAHQDRLPDDLPLEARWDVDKAYGLSAWHPGAVSPGSFANHWELDSAVGYYPDLWRTDRPAFRGDAARFVPVLLGVGDARHLVKPAWEYDETGTMREYRFAQEVFDGIMPVRLRGLRHLSLHVTGVYSTLRGLEQMYYDMSDHAAFMHDTLRHITESSIALVREAEGLGMLDDNADLSYQSSGGVGYTSDLPRGGGDYRSSGTVLLRDMWGSAESQEMAAVSPEMHEEFAMQYESRFLSLFGLTGYGCCDDLTRKTDRVLRLPGIRRVSVSPWADIEACARAIGRRAIVSIKPNPAMFAGDAYDGTAAASVIRKAARAAAGSPVEVIVKDVHTCRNDVGRFRAFAEAFYAAFAEGAVR